MGRKKSNQTNKKLKWEKHTLIAFKSSDFLFFLPIKVKMPTIVGILSFMSLINCMKKVL